jgi:hypothetical protein
MDIPRRVGVAAVKHRTQFSRHSLYAALFLAVFAGAERGSAQADGHQRTFPQSKVVVQEALKEMTPSLSGHLPVLDGFAKTGDAPLDRYQRGYFQATVHISSSGTGGSLVVVRTKITAWHADSVPSRSGYQLLASNGRLEEDLLDQLAERLAKTTSSGASSAPAISTAQPRASETVESIAMPSPNSDKPPSTFSSSITRDLSAEERGSLQSARRKPAEGDSGGVQTEVDALAEILRNQAHPQNLVAVRKPNIPVVATPDLNAKPLFLASLHDEFEMLDFTQDWVHVRISGLSRGWIWRSDLEMPDEFPDNAQPGTAASPWAGRLFHVTREQTGQFPGDWEPLRGKSVEILSVQKTDETKDSGPAAKLEFARFLLDKNYSEIAKQSTSLAGVVLIFDSADGGMIASTLATLKKWKAGALSDVAMWRECFFDPPGTFDFSPARQVGSQTNASGH